MEFKSINPATGETLASYEEMSWEEVEKILDQVGVAQKKWKATPLLDRAKLFKKLQGVLLKNKEKYAKVITQEMGKVYSQAIKEIEKCAWACEYYAENGEKFLQPEFVPLDKGQKGKVSFQPLGVILAIMPWNYPIWQVFRFAVPALMAGNGAVLKHASNVLGCAHAIEEIFLKAGFPSNLFRILLIDHSKTTKVIHHPRIAAITLTGSVPAGRGVAAEAGKALKKCVLELGGSDPFIILKDADLDKAVEMGITSRFLNTGQSCIAAKRFIVVEPLREAFESKLKEKVGALKMGDPFAEENYLGPLAREDLRDELHRQVQDSVNQGAKLLWGGKRPDGPGAFYPPTILTEVQRGMPAYSEELFGPVAAILPVKDEAEAINVANQTNFGLAGSLWTKNLEKGEQIATELIETGGCFVNTMSRSDPRLPFGGIKDSGFGRELSAFGIREFVNIHTVVVQS